MAMLGDLRSAGWNYERYPGVYPGKSGSMVPFSLILLHSLLPSYSGDHDQALARLYALLDYETNAAPAEASSGGAARFEAKRAQIILSLVNVMCAPFTITQMR